YANPQKGKFECLDRVHASGHRNDDLSQSADFERAKIVWRASEFPRLADFDNSLPTARKRELPPRDHHSYVGELHGVPYRCALSVLLHNVCLQQKDLGRTLVLFFQSRTLIRSSPTVSRRVTVRERVRTSESSPRSAARYRAERQLPGRSAPPARCGSPERSPCHTRRIPRRCSAP